MLEAGAKEVTEEDMLAALMFAQEAIGEFCDVQERSWPRSRSRRWTSAPRDRPRTQRARLRGRCRQDERRAAQRRQARPHGAASPRSRTSCSRRCSPTRSSPPHGKDIKAALKQLEKKTMRKMVLDEGERADGRGARRGPPDHRSVGVLPRAHGSGLFTRGQTQVLSVLTLGMLSECSASTRSTPPRASATSTTTTSRRSAPARPAMRGPERRDIGHGDLAERALLPGPPGRGGVPVRDPPRVRVLESNGSTSMASACGSTLALMDAGVPIKAPVAGVAMGLITEGDEVAILTDILGKEDSLGDMDFKVTGTGEGVTALQMDIKVKGITRRSSCAGRSCRPRRAARSSSAR